VRLQDRSKKGAKGRKRRKKGQAPRQISNDHASSQKVHHHPKGIPWSEYEGTDKQVPQYCEHGRETNHTRPWLQKKT